MESETKQDSGNTQLNNCKFIKTVLMMLVVLYHSCLYMLEGWMPISTENKSKFLLSIAGWLSHFHIYAFVLISGYIFAYLYYERKRYISFKAFIINKFKRLIVPAVFVTCIWAAPIAKTVYHYNTSELFKKFFLAVSPSQLWFLYMLFWVFVINWLIKSFSLLHRGLIVGALFFLGIVGAKFTANVFQIWTSLQYCFFFYCGEVLREKRDKIKCNWLQLGVILLLDSFFYILSSRIPSFGILWHLCSICLQFVSHILGAFMAFYILQIIASKVNWEENSIFKILNEKTMVIYLFHQQIIYFVVILLEPIIKLSIVLTAINLVISIGFSYIISIIMFKYKATRTLVGEK